MFLWTVSSANEPPDSWVLGCYTRENSAYKNLSLGISAEHDAAARAVYRLKIATGEQGKSGRGEFILKGEGVKTGRSPRRSIRLLNLAGDLGVAMNSEQEWMEARKGLLRGRGKASTTSSAPRQKAEG